MSNIVSIIADKIMAARDQTDGQHKGCRNFCDRCVWFKNGGCSEWNGHDKRTVVEKDSDGT